MKTLGLLETYNIIRMITKSKSTPYLYYLPKCKKPLPFDHINQMIILSLITLSDFHCNITLFFSAGTHKRRFSARRRRSTSKRRKFRETLEGLLRLPRWLGNLLVTVKVNLTVIVTVIKSKMLRWTLILLLIYYSGRHLMCSWIMLSVS